MKEIIQKDSDHIPDVGEKVTDWRYGLVKADHYRPNRRTKLNSAFINYTACYVFVLRAVAKTVIKWECMTT